MRVELFGPPPDESTPEGLGRNAPGIRDRRNCGVRARRFVRARTPCLASPRAPRADAEVLPMSEPTLARRMALDYLRACTDIFTDAILDLVGRGDLADLATTLEPVDVAAALAKPRSSRGAINGMIAALEGRGEELRKPTRYVGSFEAASRSGEPITLRVVEGIAIATTYAGAGERYVVADGGLDMRRLGKGEYEHPVSGTVYV